MHLQAGSDVSASLTAWGSWQPALAPTRGPTVLEALIGSLGGRGSNRVSPKHLTHSAALPSHSDNMFASVYATYVFLHACMSCLLHMIKAAQVRQAVIQEPAGAYLDTARAV